MEIITLVSKDRLKTIEASMTINDMGNSIGIIITNDTFHIEAIDEYPFFALAKIRQELESKGYYILINGSRRNVYPSGMQYNAFSAYELELGKPATNTVNIFDRINSSEEVVTVKEQEEYFCKWVESLGGK